MAYSLLFISRKYKDPKTYGERTKGHHMMILLYAALKTTNGKRLYNIVKTLVPLQEIKIFQTMDELYNGLRQPRGNPGIAVLLSGNRKELSEILSFHDLFWDLSIILVLPDRKRETVSEGLKLMPRFLSYSDSNFKDVGAVLEKMLSLDLSKKPFKGSDSLERDILLKL